MLTSVIVRLIQFCTRHAWQVVAVGLLLAIASGVYSASHFAINSDISALLSSNVDWRQREVAFERAFNRFDTIIAVVDAPTPELATEATAALTEALAKEKDHFREVTQLGGGEFFAREGLLLQSSTDQLKTIVAQMKCGEPLIHDLAIDQSLRGLISGLEDGLLGLQANGSGGGSGGDEASPCPGSIKLDDFTRVFNMAADTLEGVIAGKPESFSWRVLVEGHPASASERRGFIQIRPILDYGAV